MMNPHSCMEKKTVRCLETPNNSTRTILIEDDCVEQLPDDCNKLCWLKLEYSKYAATVRGQFDMGLVSGRASFKPVSSATETC